MTSVGSDLAVAGTAARAIGEEMPESVASAVIDFVTGSPPRQPATSWPRTPQRARSHP